jgi:hypothetical protein
MNPKSWLPIPKSWLTDINDAERKAREVDAENVGQYEREAVQVLTTEERWWGIGPWLRVRAVWVLNACSEHKRLESETIETLKKSVEGGMKQENESYYARHLLNKIQ